MSTKKLYPAPEGLQAVFVRADGTEEYSPICCLALMEDENGSTRAVPLDAHSLESEENTPPTERDGFRCLKTVRWETMYRSMRESIEDAIRRVAEARRKAEREAKQPGGDPTKAQILSLVQNRLMEILKEDGQ